MSEAPGDGEWKSKSQPLAVTTLREERLHGLLTTLTNNAVWVLIQTMTAHSAQTPGVAMPWMWGKELVA